MVVKWSQQPNWIRVANKIMIRDLTVIARAPGPFEILGGYIKAGAKVTNMARDQFWLTRASMPNRDVRLTLEQVLDIV